MLDICPMRSSILLAAVAFAACTSTPDADWSAIQRDRLERLHSRRDPTRALAAVLRHDPVVSQEPRHIDQREPQGRPFHGPSFSTRAAVGYGNVAARVDGTLLNDRADARFLQVGVEASSGAGLHLNLHDSDDDLFAGTRISDGTMPAPANAGLRGADAFPHLCWQALDGQLRLPVRLGVFTDWRELRHETANVERTWLGVGPRVLLEPTLRLLGDRQGALDLVGHLGGDIGGTWFAERFAGGDDRDFTMRWTGEVGLGLRGQIDSWQVDVGYRLQHTTLGPIDTDLLGDRHRAEFQQQQLFLGLALSW